MKCICIWKTYENEEEAAAEAAAEAEKQIGKSFLLTTLLLNVKIYESQNRKAGKMRRRRRRLLH